jgi:hypothetical protein
MLLGIPKVTSTTIAVKLAHKSRRNSWNFKRICMARKRYLVAHARLYYCTSDFCISVPTHGQCKREQFGTCADILPSVNVSCDFLCHL